eukprot:CAMPEP_0195055324 /NCGR_PEP_ID=MMETSP0448-20130528/4014_1 /TAXON_ID=66468 /ORGANISM="Heterocapsa triquestra, Strain CCMP 448" /LENGTH=417 /DNA_ID=CAMNT_0040084959 /DNA_START=72 /DNA_END=1330 /DNA_ORIENTATION=-
MAGRLPEAAQKVMKAIGAGAPALLVGIGGLTAAGYLGRNAMYTVDAGHQSIKYHRLSGISTQVYREGLHFLMPWFERPIVFDIRARPYTMTSLTGSRDLQMVNISLRCLYRPDPAKLPDMYKSIGLDFDEKVLPSIINEVLKSVVAQYNAGELIQQRELVSRMIRQRLMHRAQDFYILLDDVAITHLSFSSEYEKAVEQKQVAQQQSERARYVVLKAQEEKKKTIINAEGERQSAAMIGAAIQQNPGFIELRRISTAKEIAIGLARSSNRMVLSSENLMLNLMGARDEFAANSLKLKKERPAMPVAPRAARPRCARIAQLAVRGIPLLFAALGRVGLLAGSRRADFSAGTRNRGTWQILAARCKYSSSMTAAGVPMPTIVSLSPPVTSACVAGLRQVSPPRFCLTRAGRAEVCLLGS